MLRRIDIHMDRLPLAKSPVQDLCRRPTDFLSACWMTRFNGRAPLGRVVTFLADQLR